jgi:hypothetical protein
MEIGKMTITEALPHLKSVASAPSSEVVSKVWRGEGDLRVLYVLGNEIVKSASEYSLERVLFWIKWGFEEETPEVYNHSKLKRS